ncbi:tetratricopeptide (TPR) repeat protein [Kitasatospora sp. MAP12-15]|uniref:tetratricopeptide repeat protein n=1 Tax=unclassified Kitasatospora TaxID=2633591 RepID=UPI00247412BA|nr:tetratricopeptide repeat protein [Kitasatospora sp. MAP12-44]MDH6115424.1 tetratricopeptide (TPR) repeat protein [Kitasatospora sp. MAP12-44]
MKRRRLWTGLAAAAMVSGVVTGWVHLSEGDSTTASTTKAKPAAAAAAAAETASKVGALLQAGIKQGEISDFAGATKTFQQVLALDPGNKLAWYNLGVIAQHDDNAAAARTAYDNSLKTDPGFESALYNKAILLGSSDTDQAIAILQRIVAADPKAATAYLQLGQDQLKKSQDSEAKDAFGRAVRTDPSLQELVPERFRDSASAAPIQPRNRTQIPAQTPTPTPTATQAGTSR